MSAPLFLTTAAPTAAHYQALRRLRRMVLRSQQALLIYLWTDDPRTADWLRQQLDMALRARSRRVLHHRVADEAGFRDALATVLAPSSGCENFAVWVNFSASAAPLADHWLARLNERRLQLLQWPRALILCGPTAYEARAGEVAPDLWSVRSDSLPVPAWVAADAVAAPGPALATVGAEVSGPPAAMLALWRAAWQSAGSGGAGDARRIDIGLGISAARRLLQHRQLADARAVIDQLGTVLAAMPAPPDHTVLRQRLQQQILLGDCLALQRQWPAALAATQAALAGSEALVKLTGESPEALRDWSVSLNKVGEVQRALGDVAGARERFEESLKVSERLVKLTGESPEALRDLAIALQNLGDWSQAHGEAGAARGFFERDLQAAQAALRQSALSQDIQDVVRYAQARLASLPPKLP